MPLTTLEELEHAFDPEAGLVRHDAERYILRESLMYACRLLRRNGEDDQARAAQILEAVWATQFTSPSWDQGRLSLRHPEGWRELNGTLFAMPYLAEVLREHAAKLPPPLLDRHREGTRQAVGALERRWADEDFDLHRDFKAYSNIFALYIQGLLLAGETFDDDRLRRDAASQWRRWFSHIGYFGIDEFVSPTYNGVVYEAVLDIAKRAPEEPVRHEARLVLDHLVTLQCALSHPKLGLPVSGASRHYRRFVTPGNGAFAYLNGDGQSAHVSPAAVRREFEQRTYPHRAEGRASLVPFRFKTWQLADAALGTMSGGYYFPQQLHALAAVGHSATQRACAFINADVRNRINGYVHQRDGAALCVFARTVTSFHRTQHLMPDARLPAEDSLPMSIGSTGDWQMPVNEPGRLILAAYGYTLHVHLFTIEEQQCHPVQLCEQRVELGPEGEITVYRVPGEPVWMGCVLQLLPADQHAAEPTVQCTSAGRETSVSESLLDLSLRWFHQPSGELTQLHEKDWRTMPLLACPTQTLWPGELCAQAANARHY
ncbi:MAG: hypothetical protein ACODAQ_01995 [Phycisphaeraceae bacterium]